MSNLTISKMPFAERYKYIEQQMALGNVIHYPTRVKSGFGSEVQIYFDKNTNAYSECHPWTGSMWRDITKEWAEGLISGTLNPCYYEVPLSDWHFRCSNNS